LIPNGKKRWIPSLAADQVELTPKNEFVKNHQGFEAVTQKLQLGSIFNIYCYSGWTVSHTFFSLNQGMHRAGVDCQMFVPNCDEKLRQSNMTEAVPSLLKPAVYRFANGPQFFTQTLFLRNTERFDAVYFFPESSLNFLNKIRKQKLPLISERINCHTRTARQILDSVYDNLKLPATHGITDKKIAEEDEQLALADLIFCPSPRVEESLLESGIPASKLILTSYGWSRDRFSQTATKSRPNTKQDGLTMLFVGSISVRKGAHILLDAWDKAKINGKLVLCGKLDDAIRATYSHILDREDVVWLNFQTDISRFYTEADVFVFPTLEEGGPLVTYEAMAHGLPVIVSPMGAGAIVRDKIDGIVASDLNPECWAQELRKLATDVDMRDAIGLAARDRAQSFTWERVGASRAKSLLDKLSPRIKP
jgi:glycosyltransferase involved in cell wall biosynthesis